MTAEWVLIPCEDVKVGDRHRKEMGDLDALAESIARVGLLHPIVVTPDDRLVVGARRLVAVRDHLGLPKIHARVINLDALAALQAEGDENDCRKDFTPSERVAIAAAIKEQIGERRGRPAKDAEEIPHNCAEFQPGKETRDAAAEAAGFGSREELRRAEKVVEQGAPELVELMDSGKVSISAAAEVAGLSPEEQKEVAAAGPAEVKKRAAAKRKAKKDDRPEWEREGEEDEDDPAPRPRKKPGVTDDLGIPIQDHAAAAFAELPKFKALLAKIKECQREFDALTRGPAGVHLLKRSQSVRCGGTSETPVLRRTLAHLENAEREIKSCQPAVTDCPYAHNPDRPHEENGRPCPLCHGVRWCGKLDGRTPESLIERLKDAYAEPANV